MRFECLKITEHAVHEELQAVSRLLVDRGEEQESSSDSSGKTGTNGSLHAAGTTIMWYERVS